MAKDTAQMYLPYRAKRLLPDGTKEEYGKYRWYNPFTKQPEGLGVEEYDVAYRRSRELLALGSQGGTGGGAESTASANSESQGTPAPTFVDAGKVMDAWAGSKVTPPGSSNPSQPVTDRPSGGQVPGVGATSLPGGVVIPIVRPTVKPAAPKKGQLTPEQAVKLGRAVNKVAAKLNLALLSAGVKFAGRDPFELDEDDVELLALGWELFLDEFFVKHPPKPWMLILAGNVMCASVMYLRGTPIKREEETPTNNVGSDDIIVTEDIPGAPGHARFSP